MSREANRVNIATYYEAQRAATAVASTPVVYNNRKYQPVIGTPFIRVNIREGAGQLVGLGATKQYRHTLVVVTQIFVPEDTGSKTALEMADAVDLIWRGASFNGINFQTPDIVDLGVLDGWYQVNVVAPAYWDDFA